MTVQELENMIRTASKNGYEDWKNEWAFKLYIYPLASDFNGKHQRNISLKYSTNATKPERSINKVEIESNDKVMAVTTKNFLPYSKESLTAKRTKLTEAIIKTIAHAPKNHAQLLANDSIYSFVLPNFYMYQKNGAPA